MGQSIHIEFHANAFLRHMCRILAGTIVEVGRGKRPVASITALLESGDRTRAGVTAPPQGLVLVEVIYAPVGGAGARLLAPPTI
jgi:tRNA pseudouridine38-40 synthase